MPRPPDNYTHAQFEPVESEHQGETVQCIHCKNWTGSIKTLNRKKHHLLNCPQYATWRAQGHGQDLAPPNKYSKRDSSTLGPNGWDDLDPANAYYDSPYGGPPPPPPPPAQNYTPTTTRGRNLDLSKYYDESWGEQGGQKCMRVRCLHCGYTRAKNTTRQVEHLGTCQDFLNSPEGQQAIANGEIEISTPGPPTSTYSNAALGPDIWRGGRPNPNLHVGQTGARPSTGPPHSMRPPQRPAPSLVNHLLNKWPERFQQATQQPFLSHAGCGTLSASALVHWLGQNGHVSRAMIAFIGSLISKVRLPDAANSKQNTQYRALDLLISTVSNLRKEIDFIENTKRKYGIQADIEPPSPMTKAYVDLLASSSEPRSTLLEGMVALWATEHCYCASWQYASTFASNVPSSNYSVPSYLTGSNTYSTGQTPFRAGNNNDQHVPALHEALIPNWTSREFSKFVEACRAIVDELANAETTGSGRDQLVRCEGVYQQVIFLWQRIWPEVNGMGEENDESAVQEDDDSDKHSDDGMAGPSGTNGTRGNKDGPIEIQDDDDDDDDDAAGEADASHVDSPYGGTGLGAIAAANQAS